MSSQLVRKAFKAYAEGGFRALAVRTARFSYNQVFIPLYDRYMPRYSQVSVFNGVNVPVLLPYFHSRIPGYNCREGEDIPSYEGQEISKLLDACSPGDDVVIVGGGWGVSAVRAAREVGPDGSVTVYEASEACYDKIREIIKANRVEEIVTVYHAVVGEVVSLDWSLGEGGSGTAPTISGAALPEADVYELDCEGAETTVIADMDAQPEYIVVETHAQFGVPKEETIPLLREKGYEISDIVSSGDGANVVSARRTPK